MTRNEQRQIQEPAMKEQVFEYHHIKDQALENNSCCVDAIYQPFLPRFIVYLRVKFKSRSFVQSPPQDQNKEWESLVERSTSSDPFFSTNRCKS